MQPLKNWVKRNFAGLLYNGMKKPERKRELLEWLKQFGVHKPNHPADTSFNVFTYHGEDGITAWLLSQLENVPPIFADLGSGNCIISNCSMLATHFDWKGLFVDEDKKQIAVGRKFYDRTDGLKFRNATLTPLTINSIIAEAGMTGEIGLASIDVDGNDYWLWKALEQIKPRIVIIEAKVEFGFEDKIVPYGRFNNRSVDIQYNGASVEALRKLGKKKGYKLVAANKQGYNLFFVQEREEIRELPVTDVLSDTATRASFYPATFFDKHTFAEE